ncbi:hyaluronan-binding protein 2 [Xiphias gladius]|uniref:hyaluronan-binding protein 2 n=1 Tax=Xiphias gladius TaxID=8245 RepID=UPI001A9926D6|nr:hyaluronan-binding protein 2 [Xiphias gladius]
MARVFTKMVCLLALLSQLCALTVFGQDLFVITETDYTDAYEYYCDYTAETPTEDADMTLADWLYELLDITDACDPNPCLNGGICDRAVYGGSTCLCPEPYSGKKCQTVKDVCKNVKCGHGSCVVTSTAPYYECKCKPPYKPPDCRRASPCRPNPCQNGGSCMRGPKRSSFQCSCADGYGGKFCEVGPNDCYQGDGEFYRGTVSVTVEGEECLDWNSHFILQKGGDPFKEYAGYDGLGPHNYCRNPDGDDQPWCFINKNGKLKWNYCQVRKCSAVSLPAPATPPTIHVTDSTPVKQDAAAAQFSQCGRAQPGRSARIFGGKKSLPGAHPWQVSLQTRSKGSSGSFSHICGGILLESCWVLTAAHCIKSGVEMQVVLGGVDIEKDEVYDQVVPVEKAIVHEEYKETPFALHNDVAMLQLKVVDTPYCAKETRFVKTACLPNQPFSSGTECVISGWGVTETQNYGTNQLLDARVLLISQEKCKAPHVYGDALDDSMFCAGTMKGGVDSCQGDSGGPLVCERNGTHYVVGVVSWGDGCGKKYKPGVYTNVGRFVDWIAYHLLSSRVRFSTMLAAGALLISLTVLTVHGFDLTLDDMYIDYEDYTTDIPPIFFDINDWLIDLLDESNVCDPNPCFNGGSCQSKSNTELECLCSEPYVGKRCQKVRNICENVRCGHGDCVVNLNKHPFYECKCKPPYQGPNCNSLPASPCEPNPCQNGGSCIRGQRRFRCACPDGYTGRFCGTAPTDCYEGNGETYRGVVSMTEDGEDCLDWHSYFIVLNGEDPFKVYSDFNGLEYNNHCRNPDGDEKPWCFIKKQNKLKWGFCKIKKCSEVPATPPTSVKPEPGFSQFSQCGKSLPVRINRIYGGSKCFPGAHPWQVSVQSRAIGSSYEFRHMCGGILLTSCWVLTAAHCVEPTDEFQVVLGGVNIDKHEEMDQTIPVIQTIVHENYKQTPEALYNDIALLKLKVTDSPYCARETPFVRTVCLPDQTFPAGKQCVISGWGATETQLYSSQLLDARVLLISEQRCKAPQIYGNLLDSSMLCAGILNGGIDSCQGDSGGPLVCEQNGTHYITGVVSWGNGCGQKNKPGVYANVHTFIDWIRSRIN